jgi:hypothetical protein
VWDFCVGVKDLYTHCAVQLYFLEEDTFHTNIYIYMPPYLALNSSSLSLHTALYALYDYLTVIPFCYTKLLTAISVMKNEFVLLRN